MRKQILHWMLLIFAIMMITGCKTNTEAPVAGEVLSEEEQDTASSESSSLDEAYPNQDGTTVSAEEAYPAQNEVISQASEAYPVAAEDLQALEGSWSLNAYSEDLIAKDPPSKTITFNGENYEIITDEGSRTGTWIANIDSYYPVLVLDAEGEEALSYEIITLSESILKLRTVKDQMTIEEEYLPVD